MQRKLHLNKKIFAKLLIGDWLIIVVSVMAVILMFQQFWRVEQASILKIRLGDKVVGSYDLNQTKELNINGPIGVAIISINQGKVRFKQSPCQNQYCVHHGWLSHAGQVAICIPNQISLQLIGKQASYDSLNY